MSEYQCRSKNENYLKKIRFADKDSLPSWVA